MDPTSVQINYKFLKNFISSSKKYKDRIQILQDATDTEIKCIIEIILNFEKYKETCRVRCRPLIDPFLHRHLLNLKLFRKILCVNIPALRVLVACALFFTKQCELNAILGSVDKSNCVVINEIKTWRIYKTQ